MSNKKFGPSLYFASDKVIFDALNHRQVKLDILRELLLERGIVVSTKTPKMELAHYFSRLASDFFDQKSIATKLGRVAKREKMTFAELSVPISSNDILAALNVVRVAFQEDDQRIEIEAKTDGRLIARIEYEHVDYTEVEFRQVQPRDAIIEFVPQELDNGYVVRSTKNSFTDGVVDEVFEAIHKQTGKEISRSSVSLQGLADHKLRTKFFEKLMKGIADHDFITVTEAFCYKPKNSEKNSDSDDGDDEVNVELESQPYVERVGLKGNGVNRSFVIDELYERGYYIIKIVWRVKPKKSLDSDVFELEAQFNEPSSCTGFSYQTRCAYIFENGILTDKKRHPKFDEEDALFRLIEKAAKTAYASLEA